MSEQHIITGIITPHEDVPRIRIRVQEYDRPFYLTSDMNVQAIK